MWRLNPRGREGLGAIGVWGVILLFVVSIACAVAAVGLWRGLRWGYVTAVILLSVNLMGSILNVISMTEPRAAIGIPIVIAILVYLMRQRTRHFFGTTNNR